MKTGHRGAGLSGSHGGHLAQGTSSRKQAEHPTGAVVHGSLETTGSARQGKEVPPIIMRQAAATGMFRFPWDAEKWVALREALQKNLLTQEAGDQGIRKRLLSQRLDGP